MTEQDPAIDALFVEWQDAFQRKDVDAILKRFFDELRQR